MGVQGKTWALEDFPCHNVAEIHSLIHFYSAPSFLQVLYYSEALPTTARILLAYQRFTPKRTGNCSTVGKGLAQGPYVAARAGVESTTLQGGKSSAQPRALNTDLATVWANIFLP